MPRIIVEQRQRLSRSLLWTHQRRFFRDQGPDAWGQGYVPHYITTNPVIAHRYAQVVAALWRESAPDRGPINVVELGAGVGRLAFYFLRSISELLDEPTRHEPAIRYVMTDISDKTAKYWRDHPALAPFIDSGHLDFAAFDAEEPEPLELMVSGETLTAGSSDQPLVVIANYVFDGLTQDAFTLRNGVLSENLVTIQAAAPPPQPGDPTWLTAVDVKVTRERVDRVAGHYDDPDLDALLQWYAATLRSAMFTFPTGAVECFRWFQHLSPAGVLVLSADRGDRTPDDLAERTDLGIAVHGSLSLPVNYHALAELVRRHGGQVLDLWAPPDYLQMVGFILGVPEDAWPATRLTYHDVISRSSPEDMYHVSTTIRESATPISLPQALALLRVNRYDPAVFIDLTDRMIERLDAGDPGDDDADIDTLVDEVVLAARATWDSHYHLAGEEEDVAFHIGQVLYAADAYDDALEFFEHSHRLVGPDPATWFNIGLCHHRRRRLKKAEAALDEALALNPKYDRARRLRTQIWSESTKTRKR